MYTPFDFNEIVGHKKEFCDDRLREGSPVVGVSYDEGLLLLTVRRTQRKIFEIYDRQMFSAIGNQSDIENLRVSTINIAHQEGFERSPDDVTLQRLVGFALSPALKKAFGDHLTMPFVVKAVFAEIGRTPAADGFVTLNYDGEYRGHHGVAVVGGTQAAEDRMIEVLGEPDGSWSRDEALRLALKAWVAGARAALRTGKGSDDDDEFADPLREVGAGDGDEEYLRSELENGSVEAAVLERGRRSDSHFRLLRAADLEALAVRGQG